MQFHTRLHLLTAIFLFGVCSALSQEKQELKLQINSRDTIISFQWATINGKSLLLMGRGLQGERSTEVNLAGNVEDSISQALHAMGFHTTVASFICPSIKIDSAFTFASYAIQLTIGTCDYAAAFEMLKKNKTDSLVVTFKEKKETVVGGELNKALENTGIFDVIEKKVSGELYLSRNSIEIELSKRLHALESLLPANQPIGEIQLRTSKILPFVRYRGYWGICGPIKKGGWFHGLWSYLMPYLWQIEEIWKVELDPGKIMPDDSVDIKEVEIAIQNGSFNQIVVRTQKKNELIDFYSDAPISIAAWNNIYNYNYESRYESILFAKNRNGDTLVFRANDLLYYTIHPQSRGNYIPRDTIVILKPGKEPSRITLMRQDFMNNFDLRVYSDFSGLKKESPNGLLQLDLRYKFILNNSETGTFFDAYQLIIYPAILSSLIFQWEKYDKLPYITGSLFFGSLWLFSSQTPTCFATKIEPFVIMPRLEERGNLLIKANDTVSAEVNRFDLYRFSNLKFGLDLEYLRVRFDQLNLFASIGASAGIIRTTMDSLVLRSEKLTGSQYLHSYFVMPYIQIEPISVENVKFVTRYSLLASKLMDRKINTLDMRDGLSGSFIHVFQSDFSIYTDTRDKSSWIFFRAIYYASNPYSDLSLQFGYSTSLNNVFNLGKGK